MAEDLSQRAGSATCSQCAASIPAERAFCPQCGTSQGSVCGYCQTLLPSTARFCSRCGTSASFGRTLRCPGCENPIASLFAYCPQCGQSLQRRCLQCGGPVVETWQRCPTCGDNLEVSSPSTRPSAWSMVPQGNPEPTQVSANSPSQTPAEEHNARGMHLYEQEEYEEAVREFEAALDLAPGTPLFHCNLGVAYAELGRDDEALEEYQTAIRLAPNDPTAYLNLGYFFSERENAGEARRAWEKTIALSPNSPEAEEARQNIAHLGDL